MLPGSPLLVVCDNDGGLVNAVRSRFPAAELSLCEWHLRHALERLMGKIRTASGHRHVIDELLGDVGAAFTGLTLWTPFVERAHAAGIPRLSEWLSTTGQVVEEQFRRRGQRSTRPVEMPLTTSPLDGFINPIRAAIGPRAYGLKNRGRTDRLLMLSNYTPTAKTTTAITSDSSGRAWRPITAVRTLPAVGSSTSAGSRHYGDHREATHRRVHSHPQNAPVDAWGGCLPDNADHDQEGDQNYRGELDVRPRGDAEAMSNGERDEDGFPLANADNDGSVYVDEFEVAWVCEYEHDLGYIWRSLGPVHRPPTEE